MEQMKRRINKTEEKWDAEWWDVGYMKQKAKLKYITIINGQILRHS